MVLYCVQHPGNILKALVHKFKYHPKDDAIFFTEQNASSPYCPQFDKIKYYKMPDVNSIVSYAGTKEEVIKNTDTVIKKFFADVSIDLSNFDNIYLIYDMYNPFALYFELNKIKYMCIEAFNNLFNLYWLGNHVESRLKSHPSNHIYDCLIRDMHLQDGQGKNCLKGYLFSEQSIIPKGGIVKTEIFDYFSSLLCLDKAIKEQMIDVFKLKKYNFDTMLLLNSQGWTYTKIVDNNLNIPQNNDRLQVVISFYKIILDYYFSKTNFVLKLHPASNENFINSFSDFSQIPSYVPAEIFSILDKSFTLLCPAVSTSLYVFKKLNFDIKNFGVNIFNFFDIIHFIFSAFSLINATDRHFDKIYFYGIDLEQVKYFRDWAFTDFKDVNFCELTADNVKNAKFIITDKIDQNFENIIKNVNDECTILINDNYDVNEDFSRQKMVYQLVDLSKKDEQELQEFTWTVISKSSSNLETASTFTVTWILKHAKLRILVTPYITKKATIDKEKIIEIIEKL